MELELSNTTEGQHRLEQNQNRTTLIMSRHLEQHDKQQTTQDDNMQQQQTQQAVPAGPLIGYNNYSEGAPLRPALPKERPMTRATPPASTLKSTTII